MGPISLLKRDDLVRRVAGFSDRVMQGRSSCFGLDTVLLNELAMGWTSRKTVGSSGSGRHIVL